MPKGRFAKDLTGQAFGLLTVTRRAPNYISKTDQEAVWHCRWTTAKVQRANQRPRRTKHKEREEKKQ